MKQVVQNYKSGELSLADVPVPQCKPGGVLVRTRFSLISTGTELMKVSEAGMSLAGKARARPDQVAKVLQSVSTNGVRSTYEKVLNRLDSYTPLGYSLCGVVEEVGSGVDELSVGDVVACAGNEHALHAELNWVPLNLCARVPDGVDPRHAAFGTVGAIAMQGVRRGEPQLGELAVVIGLGLIGQLVTGLLVASGVRVIGVDPDERRCDLARRMGASACQAPGSVELDAALGEHSGGIGSDQVYLCAGGGGNEPVELAARLSRDRGRVVDIGKCGLNLPWNAYYEKELDVRFSRSYGPGRYDAEYELEGRDYPVGYVRWTERRNLRCFLDLLARRRIDVAPLISHIADFSAAERTYRQLSSGELDAIGVLFSYPEPEHVSSPPEGETGAAAGTGAGERPPRSTPAAASPIGRPIRIACLGAGNHASSMLLPHLADREDVALDRVVTTTSLSAANAVRKFGFAVGGTDPDEAIDDPDVDAVFVLSRHSSHAELARRALLAGKATFVEKPLALGEGELESIRDAVAETGNDRLHVGFNRRFAPLLRRARERFGTRSGPATVRYLVNAGGIDSGSWYARKRTEGSRFTGEGGHFVDTISWLLGSDPCTVRAWASPGQADLHVVLGYPDGSTGLLTYTTSGPARFPKETIELLADGKAVRFDDFARMRLYGRPRLPRPRLPRGRDKGHAAQLDAVLGALRGGAPMPVPFDSLLTTSSAVLAVNESIATGRALALTGRQDAVAAPEPVDTAREGARV